MLSPRLISRLHRIDWDFAGAQSESLFSAIHWHPARFASQIPATLIGLLSEPGQVVLDPFAGSATTLVEAQRLGRRAIGIDLNPVSALIARSKTLAIPAKKVKQAATNLKDECIAALNNLDSSKPSNPPAVQDKWYTPKVRRQLGRLWTLIEQYGGIQRVLAKAAFSAILLPVCRETRHWGYVCDNSTPVDNHGGDVISRYCETLDRFICAYEDRDLERIARLGKVGPIEKVRIKCGNSLNELPKLTPCSVDLAITSPPYFGVSDYIKSQRLSMEWFGYELEPLRKLEIGARSKRHRTEAVGQYTSELAEVFSAMLPSLKQGAPIVVVIGESEARIAVLQDTIKEIINKGFTLVHQLERRVSSQRRQAPSVNRELIWFFVST